MDVILCMTVLLSVASLNDAFIYGSDPLTCFRKPGGKCMTEYQGVTQHGCNTANHQYEKDYCGPYNICCYYASHGGVVTQPHYTQAPFYTFPPVTQPGQWPHYTQPSSHQTGSHTCGASMDPTMTKIVGGTTARQGQFPWQVSLQFDGGWGTKQHMCGGTLVAPQWVVTAAHCFEHNPPGKNPAQWFVGIGLSDRRQASAANLVTVQGIYPHEQFVGGNSPHNDIAMVKLSKPIDVSGGYVGTACLPTSYDTFPGDQCYISGWGYHHFVAPPAHAPVSEILEYITLTTMTNAQCQRYDGVLQSSQMCAGATLSTGGHGPCLGDSGGPLVCKKNGAWTLAGVISFGAGCAEVNKPGIYTRVSSFEQWIQTHIQYY